MMKPIYLLSLAFTILIFTTTRADDTISCNFEDVNICGYTHDTSDDFNWVWFSGPTSSHNTGPDNDHTFSSSVGHYMYIEASFPDNKDIARLISKKYSPPATEQCLEFWYHMHGSDIGSLKVYFKRGENLGGSQFTQNGDKGNRWLQALVTIPVNSQPFQVVFEGVCSGGYRGDIAIDDITLRPRSCGVTPVGPDYVALAPNTTTLSVKEGHGLPVVMCGCGHCIPACNRRWVFNGVIVSNSSRLQIENMNRSSAGIYTCKCVNPETARTKSTSFQLQIMFGPDYVTLAPNATTLSVEEGHGSSWVICGCGHCIPTCNRRWVFNGVIIGNSSRLQIENMNRSAAGIYTCKCVNPETAKTRTTSFQLHIIFGPDSTVLQPNTTKMSVQEGFNLDTVMCGCDNCFPSCSRRWVFNGSTVENSSLLHLINVTRHSAGTYKCVCTNSETSVSTSAQFLLSVIYGPDHVSLVPNTSSLSVREGFDLQTIMCGCENCFPSCIMRWAINNLIIGNSSRLQMHDVRRISAGIYSCSCVNPATSQSESAYFNLSVIYGPDEVTITPNNTTYTVQEGSALGPITCDCGTCEPNCGAQWTFNGIVLSNNSLLQLSNISRSFAGQYSCICENPSSSKQETQNFTLTILYGPDSASLMPSNTSYILHEDTADLEVSCFCGDCLPYCNQYWVFNGERIRTNQSLYISSVLRNNAGQYQCICINPSSNEQEVSNLTVSVLYGPDEVTVTPNYTTHTIREGSALGPIACDCGTCDPNCGAQWTFNGIVLSNNSLLQLSNISRSFAGQYSCICKHLSSSKQETQNFTLTVQYGPDSASLMPSNTSYILQEDTADLEIACFCGDCQPECNQYWTFNGYRIRTNQSLYISSVLRNNAGQYQCICINPPSNKQEVSNVTVSVLYGPDEVTVTPNYTTYTIQEGSALGLITCDCGTCEPDCEAQWTFNGLVLSNNSLLQLNNISRNFAGQYSCICKNPSSSKQETQNFTLTIKYGPGSASLMPPNTSYILQEDTADLEIACFCGDCQPDCNQYWTFNGDKIGTNQSLYINSVCRNNSGQYQCICINPSSNKQEVSALTINVLYGPDEVTVTPNYTTYTIQEGSALGPITCDCGTCEPNCGAQWTLNGVVLSNSSLLQLSNISRSFAGQYSCICKHLTSSKQETQNFTLTIQYGPDSASLMPSNKSYILQEDSTDLEIACVCGDCQPDCNQYWTFNGETTRTNQSLYISSVLRNNSGQYQCICINPSSNKQEVSDLTVSVLYGPDEVTITPNHTTYTIQEGSALGPITCDCGTCQPNCGAQWTVNGIVLSNNGILQLTNISRSFAGQYSCICKNRASSEQETQNFTLTIQYGPDSASLMPSNTSYTLQEDTTDLEIACFCGDCQPDCNQYWTFNGDKIRTNQSLYISSVLRKNAGQYQCICINPSSNKQEVSDLTVSVHYGPDEVTITPNYTSYTIEEGSALGPITCDCGTCEPNCGAQWIFNGIVLSSSNILQLSNISRNLAGQYSCICKHLSSSEQETKKITLTIKYGPDSARLMPSNTRYTLQEDTTDLEVSCFCGDCQPDCNQYWTFNGDRIGTNQSLYISSVLRNNAGQYQCICINPSSNKQEVSDLTVTVLYGPDEVIVTPNNTTYTIQEGSVLGPITCDCGTCEPNCGAQWTTYSLVLSNNSLMQLSNISRSFAGQYSCICKNPATSKQEALNFTLTVQYGPDSASLMPSNTSYTLQEDTADLEVSCFCGDCQPDCNQYWIFNGDRIGANQSLYISSVLRNNAGQYQCICINPSSNKQEVSDLTVTVLYGPDEVIVTPNNTTYTIQEGSALGPIICDCGTCEPNCGAHWTTYSLVLSNNSLMQLSNISRSFAGQYSCICKNPATSKQEALNFTLTVQYGPDSASLMPSNTSYTLQEDSADLEVSCFCGDCQPDCNQYWIFNGDRIGTNQSLYISSVLRNNAGQYQCICINPSSNKQEVSDLTVTVLYGPDVAVITPNSKTYNKTVGSPLHSITCTCGQCEPRCNAEWSLNSVPLNSHDVISFKSLSIDDSGKYVCTCLNPSTLNSEVQHFDLTVNAIQNVQPCPKDIDDRGTTWEETLAGEIVSKDCQDKDSTGTISRMCSKGGTWLLPEYDCIRSSFADVEKKLEQLTTNASHAVVTSVLDKLENLTDSSEGDEGMYSGELRSVTRALDTVATLAKSGSPPTEEQSVSFVTVASNLLSEDKKESWQSLSQTEDSEGASKLLKSIDTLSESMTKGLDDTNKSVITIVQPNIVLEARKVDVSQKEIKFPMPSEDNANSFQGAILSLPLQHGSGSAVGRYTVALYKSLSGFLPNTVSTRNDTEKDRSQMLNTPVISLQVFPSRPKLDKGLKINFEHQQANFRNPKCTYWSFDRKRWESDGCHAISSTGSETTCECYHLTNFAVLMSPWHEPTADSAAIEIISIVGCSISILCLIATAAAHIALWRYLKNDRAIILINICVALTATYIIFLSGVNQTSNKAACTAVAALLHYILLVVFCLMLAEGIEITITVKYVFITKSRIKWMIPLAWGIPAAIVGLSMGITRLNGYGNENFCWLSIENGVIWAFVGPAMLIIVVNLVFLAILLRTMLRTKAYMDMSELDRIKCSARCLCVLVPLMGCTWLLGIFYVNDRSAWIQYVFALCNSLQGCFIFLFHCLLNKQLRTAVKSRHKKYKDSHSMSKASSSSTKRTEVTMALNPVFSSDVPIEAKPNPVLKYGRKLSLQFKKTGSYSPLQE